MMIVIATDTRQRMVRSAALLFREQGYSGTGFRDIVEHSGAPPGDPRGRGDRGSDRAEPRQA
jgi:AcrR family transcriptional regulator